MNTLYCKTGCLSSKNKLTVGFFSPEMLFLSKINAKGQMSLDVPGLLLSLLTRVV